MLIWVHSILMPEGGEWKPKFLWDNRACRTDGKSDLALGPKIRNKKKRAQWARKAGHSV
jgi:hypothetical protein